MDLEDAMAALPATYAKALRLRDQGLPIPEIAIQLEVPIDSATTLMHLAEAKLARLLASSDPSEGVEDGMVGS